MSDLEKKATPPNKHIPRMCYGCKFMTEFPLEGGLANLYVCGHPTSLQIKGGMNAVEPMEPPNEDCPFVVYEERYKNNPIMRWFWRWRLKRAKRLDPKRG